MWYPILKAFHLVAVVVFISGMMVSCFAVAALRLQQLPQDLREKVLRWDRNVTSPALGLLWALGLTLAVLGGWFQDVWFIVKFVLVFALSAFHGLVTGRLRKGDASGAGIVFQNAQPVFLVTIAVVVLLASLKPFL